MMSSPLPLQIVLELWYLSARDQGPKNTSERSPAPLSRRSLRILLEVNANILGQTILNHQCSGVNEPGSLKILTYALLLADLLTPLHSLPLGGGLTNLRLP